MLERPLLSFLSWLFLAGGCAVGWWLAARSSMDISRGHINMFIVHCQLVVAGIVETPG